MKTSDLDEPDLTQLVSELAQSAQSQAAELARIRDNVDPPPASATPRKQSLESGQNALLKRITELEKAARIPAEKAKQLAKALEREKQQRIELESRERATARPQSHWSQKQRKRVARHKY